MTDMDDVENRHSLFMDKRVIFTLNDHALDCMVIGLAEECGFMYYKCLIEGGKHYYQAADAIIGVTIVEDYSLPEMKSI